MALRIDGRLTAPPRCNAALQLLVLLYADDGVLLAPTAAELRTALLAMESEVSTWGMQLSHAKTMVMVCTKHGMRRGHRGGRGGSNSSRNRVAEGWRTGTLA